MTGGKRSGWQAGKMLGMTGQRCWSFPVLQVCFPLSLKEYAVLCHPEEAEPTKDLPPLPGGGRDPSLRSG